jgi:hypothetical protein
VNWRQRVLRLFLDLTQMSRRVCCLTVTVCFFCQFNPRIFEGIVGSICNAMEIPHIMTNWSPLPLGGRVHPHRMTINVYPHSDTLARAMADVITDYTWKSYTIIYESDEGTPSPENGSSFSY